MKIYDISMRVDTDMPVYKNKQEKRPVLKNTRNFSAGKIYETKIEMDLHTGTHIDAPLHVIVNGGTVEGIALEKLIIKCKVIDLTAVSGRISRLDLEGAAIEQGDFILLKTKNSFDNCFNYEFVYLDYTGAEFLRSKGVVGVGIDSLGIERDQQDYATHKTLLEAEIVILEGLRLADIEEGEYLLCALPLKLSSVEAAPVRAVLLDWQ